MKKTICSILACLVALCAAAMLASCEGDTGNASTFKPTNPSDVSVESSSPSDLQTFEPYDPNDVC